MADKPIYEELEQKIEELELKAIQRIELNEELRKSKELFEKTFISQRDAIFILDSEFPPKIIDWNPAAVKAFGYTRQEMLGRSTIFLHTNETTLKKFQENLYPSVEDRGYYYLPEFEMKKKDGTVFATEHSVFPLQNEQGERIGWVSVIRDITKRKLAEEALQKAHDEQERRVEERTTELAKVNENLKKKINELKQSEKALRESRALFRAIFETAKDSIFIKDRHLRYTLVNPAMEHLFGVPASQLLGKSDEELFGDEAGAHIREVDSCVLRGEIIEEEDTKPVSGVLTTFHVIKVPIRDNSGEIISLCGIARNITKQNQAKEALKKAHEELEQRVKERTAELSKINDQLIQEIEERKQKEEELRKYARIVDASNDHMSLADRNYVYQLVNDAYLRSRKLKREDIIGHSFPELFGQEFFKKNQKPMIDRCLAGEVVRYQSWIDIPALGRRYMAVAYYPYYEDNKSVSGYVVNAHDITESKQAGKALRESEERYKSLFKNNHSVMLLIDPESANIVDANPAAISFYGWSYEELIRNKITDINTLTERQVFQEMKRAKMEQRRIFNFKHRLASGKIRDVEVYSGPIEVHGRELLYSIIHDITKRKQAELSLIERGKELENKSHELEEVNAALKVLLKHRDEDKKDFEEKIVTNVKRLVFPYIEKLYNSQLNDWQMVYLNIIKSNLVDIIAPFLHQLSMKYSDLTPSEIQVAGLVKDGKTTKEIAKLLNSSTDAIDFHRNNLRKKLDLRNTKTNLRSFLLSLT